MTTCNAIIRVTAGEWNLEPVECSQVVGIKTYESTRNGRVGFCSRPGHELSVRGRFAEQQDPPEPEWDLEDGPDHADSMTYAKAWEEWLRGEGGDIVRFGP